MLHYLGKGREFKKEDCKEYKTLEGARKAFDKAVAAGDEMTVWDENGVIVIAGKSDDGQQRGAETSTDEPNGNNGGNILPETGTGENGADTQPQNGSNDGGEDDSAGGSEQQDDVSESDTDKVIVPEGAMKATVICDGTLNLRRSPNWGNTNICGRASRGQTYYVKEIHTVNGKKIIRTIDDLYLSGASEHVQFEQL